jgi:L-threonylcarbamoyladenylate synthase
MERILLTSSNTQDSLKKAASILRNGGLVIYPTETLYGVAVDATNSKAVDRLLTFKARPAGKAISVLVKDKAQALTLIEPNPDAEQIFETLLPGPITVICKDKGVVDPRLASELGTLGIRISSHPIAAALSESAGIPVTATSANSSGAPRPYTVERMLEYLSPTQASCIDLILDYGELPKKEPSTVIDTTTPVQTIVRAGGEIERLAPPFITNGEEETKAYAAHMMSSFAHVVHEKPLVFALEGPMGMGKTRFAQGIGRALGVTRPVTSPSFTLIKEYLAVLNEKSVRFVHMDLWRAEDIKSEEIGLEEYLQPDTVVVIEWPNPVLKDLSRREDILIKRIIFEEKGPETRALSLAAL